MAAKVKNENYVTIQGWMINDMHLSGNELIAYAVIYGFTQADGQYMTCSQEYISNWCNISRESTNRLLKRMEEKRLIIKETASRCCRYRAVRTCDESSQMCDESSQSCDETSQMCDETSQKCDESSHNNNIIYTSINNTYTSHHINGLNDVIRLEDELFTSIAFDVIEDAQDRALIKNLIDVLISDVFSKDDAMTINVNSKAEPDYKPVYIIKNVIMKNLNYGTAKAYINSMKKHGRPVRSTQYIVKTIYQTCLSSQTIEQSIAGYARY